MALKEDLETKIRDIFSSRWDKRVGNVIPGDNSLGLGNNGIEMEGTVLYADLSSSTQLVDLYSPEFAAEIYKTYLFSAARIIRAEGGEVTAYDGDRVMGVFIGDSKNSNAAKAALKINAAVRNIINPAITKQYGSETYTLKQVVGIDTSQLLIAKTGIRGANDLVWVGRAANYAAKLCSLTGHPTFITEAVYNRLNEQSKFCEGVDMWEKQLWTAMNNTPIYASTYWWSL